MRPYTVLRSRLDVQGSQLGVHNQKREVQEERINRLVLDPVFIRAFENCQDHNWDASHMGRGISERRQASLWLKGKGVVWAFHLQEGVTAAPTEGSAT